MVARTENDLPAALFCLLRAQLRIAAAHTDHRSRVFLPEPPDHLARLAPALRCDRTGVDNYRIRCFSGSGSPVSPLLKEQLHRLRFILIYFTSES